eukprot:CAMPEP_0170169122 /NCGR_PEP_ID=MMETSP0040_2-20121228/2064_1 /TAXON_ID=641309 /ORGANISM="Lotharella oceanica, Strain CCMP622" /LENGTH=363 /DNA_ID=CAMNT_0010407695 /DNA_START=43 /DNA_END=1131 /DNA_ORIENTATION=-
MSDATEEGFIKIEHEEEVEVEDAGPVLRKAPVEEGPGKSMEPERMAKGFIEKLENSPLMPKALKPHAKELKKVVPPLSKLLRLFLLGCQMLYTLWANIFNEIKANDAEDYLPAIAGLVMVFYGGSFTYLIAAIEAYHICGWEKTKKCYSELYRNYSNVVEADTADDKKLQEKNVADGIASEEEMSDEEYLNHKLDLILRVISPQQAFDAAAALLAGFFAIVATLKNGTAASITLGVAMGSLYEKAVKVACQRDLQYLFGEHRAWASPVLSTTCCLVGVTLSWVLGDTAFVLYSALKGSDLIVHACKDVVPRGSAEPVDSDTDVACVTAKVVLSILGFVKQMAWGYGTWFPLNLVVSPFLIADW